jgi:ubiquinone/menaquinone biosynthesis C-methylase UbiE
MPPSPAKRPDPSKQFEFLVVDEFIRDLMGARALKTAFELRLIDHLMRRHPESFEALQQVAQADRAGLQFILDMLTGSNVVEMRDGGYELTARFRIAMRYRDLLETRLDFAGFLCIDYLEYLTGLVVDPSGFMGKSRLFRLFDYGKAMEPGVENYQRTRTWMRLTTTLTRYEAQACLTLHDFSPYRNLLDIGGNSGEFALQLCRRNPALQATVMDLPLVCDIGLEHVLPEPERDRIRFVKGDARKDELPAGHDLVAFKSMLHDWPEDVARHYLARAARALQPGGTLMVFERAPLELKDRTPAFSTLPTLLFFRSYRPAAFYAAELQALGFTDVAAREVELESTFYLVTGRKPAA